MRRTGRAVILAAAMAMALGIFGMASHEHAGSKATVSQRSDAREDAAPEIGGADEPKVYKVGIVQYVDDASLNQIVKAISKELDQKGAALGVTFAYEAYTFNGQADQTILAQIGAELIADEVDIIIPVATPAAVVMQTVTEEHEIPIVFSAVSDPVGAGLLADMDAPGGRITGTSDAIDTKHIFELMLAAEPEIGKVGFLYDKGQASSIGAIKEAKEYCRAKGIAYVEKTGTNTSEISAAADALVAESVDAVFTPQDNTVMAAELAIFEKFVGAGIPHYTGADSFARNGAFCGSGVNYTELGTQTADMAVEILVNGKEPTQMPVQTPESGIVTVNTETARAVGIDPAIFADRCKELRETVTAEEFE